MPWVGIVSTVPDMYRFAETLRRGGTLDGARVLSPAVLAQATRNWTGEKPNELYSIRGKERGWDPVPGYIGLGFSLRGTVGAGCWYALHSERWHEICRFLLSKAALCPSERDLHRDAASTSGRKEE